MSVYGCEFSPDGSKLYASSYPYPGMDTIFQWDLTASSPQAISASRYIVFSNGWPPYVQGMQLAPDGRIFVANNFQRFVGAISFPNVAGSGCSLDTNVLSLVTGTCDAGLPNFITTWFRQKPVISAFSSMPCGIRSFSVQSYNYYPGITYSVQASSWNFGDPSSGSANTSTLSTPQHTFSKNGKYAVRLVTQYQCYADTIVDTVTINDYPQLSVSGRQNICSKESTTLVASGAASYQWSNSVNTQSLVLSPQTNTVLSVTGTGSNGCQAAMSVSVTVDPCLKLTDVKSKACRIYPNPVHGLLTIEAEPGTKLYLYNGEGRLIEEIMVTDPRTEHSLQGIAGGFYFVRIEGQGGGQVLIID
jgi:PKD repeat protein